MEESGETTVNTASQEESALNSEEIPELENAISNLSASIVVDKEARYGTTEYVANMIADEVGGDLYRIETVTPYTADFDELQRQATRQSAWTAWQSKQRMYPMRREL